MQLNSQDVSTRIFLPIVMIGGLILALVLGRWVAQGNYTNIIYVCVLSSSLTFLLWTGNKYWYGIPFALGSALPALPLGVRAVALDELLIVGAISIFIARIAMKKETPIIFRGSHFPVLLFIGWVAFIYCLNPSGLIIFGAETAGARFYIKLLLAFGSFVILASQDLSEANLKWPIRLMFIGLVVSVFYGLFSYRFLGPAPSVVNIASSDDDFYSWQQVLAGPAITLAFLLFAKYKPSSVFRIDRLSLIGVYLLCIYVSLLSGKRMGLVAVVMAPFVGAVVHRQFRYVVVFGMLFFVFSGVVTLGQGNVFSLPPAMQRAMSFLPAKWDERFQRMTLGTDDFRTELRRFAAEKVRKHPLIGQGFSVDVNATASAITAATGGGDAATQTLAGALGHAWHNTWIGYSADFGIPIAVIHAALLLTVIVVSFRLGRLLPSGSYRSIFVIYVLMFTVRDVIASHTSGHSALDAFNRWWMYGGLFSIWAAYWVQKKANTRLQHSTPPLANTTNAPSRVAS